MDPNEMARRASERRKRFEQLRRITPQQAQNLTDLARENPSLTPGALYGAGVSGVQSGTPASKALGEADREVKSEKGNWFQRAVSGGYKAIKVTGSALLPDEVGQVAGGIGGVAKGFTRGATMGPVFLGQAAQGIGRAAYADGFQTSDLRAGVEQTDLYQANREVQQGGGYRGLLTGDTKVDYGSGFFAGGNVAKQRRAAEVESSGGKRIGGSTYTLGRYLASEVNLEPGTKAFSAVSGLADAVVSLGTDPTSYTPKVLTRPLQARAQFAGAASRRFDAAGVAAKIDQNLVEVKAARFGNDPEVLAREMGALRGIRDTVDSDRVLEFLTTDRRGQQLVGVLAKETDFGKLYDATKGKVDPRVLLKLSEREMAGDEVIQVLGPLLGRTARTEQKFGVDAVAKADVGLGGIGTLANASFKQKLRDTRIFGVVPERVLPKNDLDTTLVNASNFLRNATVTGAERSEVLRRFAQADGGEGMFEATKYMMQVGAKKAMDDFGVDKAKADELFKFYENSSSGRRKFWQEQVVVNGEKKGFTNQGFNITDEVLEDGSNAPLPHLASQFLDNNIPLPDPREIRAAMSKYKSVLSLPGVQPSKRALEFISDDIFKPLVLLRPAYIVRNQIDEQFRPAGVGMNSLMSHPVQYLHWLLSDQEGVGKMLGRAGFNSRGATDVNGLDFDELGAATRAAKEALDNAKRSGDSQAIVDAKAAYETASKAVQSITPFTDGVSAFVRSQTGGLGNWRNRSFAQINGDELYQRRDAEFARAMGEGLHRVFNDPLAKRIARGDDLDAIKADWWQGGLQKFRTDLAKQGKRMSYLEDELGAARYVDDTVEFVKAITGGSPELRAAAASGRISGVPLTDGDTLEVSKRALDKLNELKQLEGFQGPDAVLGSTIIKGGGEDASGWNKAVDAVFYQIAERPTRFLSKSPVFRQRYYQRMEGLIGFMEPGAAEEVIKGASAANLKGKEIKRLQAKRGNGKMSLEEADLVAKTDALEFTEELFYSLHNRSQFFDVFRLLFPFGEAFLDSAKKYTQLTAKNPVLPYRLTQVIQGARDADLNGDGKGFFYTDEQTGQEMFAFPGSQALLGALGQRGAGQLRAPVQNLNILGTSVIPGFGPAVQLGAALMLPDEPDFNAVQKFLSPYGERSIEGGVVESFLPAWFNKFRTAMDSDQLSSPKQRVAFAQTTKDWMGYLASTGDYNVQDPADAQRLLDDAKGKARTTFFIRGLAQAIAPSPPSPEFLAKDKDGRLLTQFKLAEEYRRIQKEAEASGNPESANRVFIETFGEQAVLAVMPNTKAAPDRSPVPPNKEAMEFYQRNKGAADRFPTVFGLFAPDEEGAEFDFTAYRRSIERGERVLVTPEEAIRRANQTVARMIYSNAKAVVGEEPDRDQKDQLKALKDQLSEDFPGYSASFNNDTPALLEDLKRAAADPTLGTSPAGEGLKIWLRARDVAERQAQEEFGVSWRTSDKAREVRDRMRALGDRLSEDFVGFGNIYDRALEREMAKDN